VGVTGFRTFVGV